MLRVLHSVSNMARAGIETMLMNYYREIDRSQIQFDFLANKPAPGEYEEEIRSMGGRIFVSPGLNPLHYPQYKRYMADLLHGNPDIIIVHAHNEAMGYYALQSAKDAGVRVRIAHAHSTRIIQDYKYPLKLICKQLLPGAATDYWSCGREAGIYYYGEKRWNASGFILRNAIDVSRFAFQPEVRERLRQVNGLENCFVIGHVGRFNVEKNHIRLMDILAEIAKAIPDPSLFEGLPVVGIEAQAAGLPCFFSDRVTDEILLSPEARRISLQADDAEWAREIIAARQSEVNRNQGKDVVRQAGYDIHEEAQKLQEIYLELADHAYSETRRQA